MEPMDRVEGEGRLLTASGEELAAIRYEYQVDRRNRVWHGTARRLDGTESIAPPAGPAEFVTAFGARAAINYYQRSDTAGTIIVFTGRGAPPGE